MPSPFERLKTRGATDAAIWAYARDHGYTIVSKDNDFRQYRFSMGRRGLEAGRQMTADLFRCNAGAV